MTLTRHSLPDRARGLRLAGVGAVLLSLGLVLGVVIAMDLAASNARDLSVNEWFWSLGQSNPWVLGLAERASWLADGPRNILIVAVVAIVLVIARQWRWAVFFVLCSQLGVLLSNALKFSIARERPPFIENTDLQQHLSFPSGHTLAGFTVWCAMAIMAWYLLRRPWSTMVAVALVIVGLLQLPSRLIVGKHWLTDVIGGALLGAGWLLLCFGIFVVILQRGRDVETGNVVRGELPAS